MNRVRGVWLALLLVPFLAAPAAAGVAVGGFGGYNFTILQDDAGSGALFGFKAKIGAPVVVLEPTITFISVGDKENEDEDVGTFMQKGGSIASYELNASFGSLRTEPGVGLWVGGGVGAYSLKSDLDYVEDQTRFGFNVGTGLVFKAGAKFDVEIGGRFYVISLDGGGSRKSAGVYGGLNYYFGFGGGGEVK
ncbi:MAG: hypothetical protein ABIK65_00185 [Candidatus Eisenbacteria bacterium]